MATARSTVVARRGSGRWRLVVPMLVVAASALLCGPLTGRAHAATPLPPALEENFDSVFAFLEDGGIPNGRASVPCDDVCKYLRDRAFPPPPSPSSPPAPSLLTRVGSLLYRLRTWVEELPKPVKTFGVVPLLVGANAYVWRKVYNDAKALFVGVDVPPQPTPNVTHVRFEDEGALLLVSGATTPQTRVYAPEHGMVGAAAYGSTVWDQEGTGGCSYIGGPIQDPTFGGFGNVTSTGLCSSGAGSYTVAVAFKRGVAAHVTSDPQPSTLPPLNWPGSGEGTNGESAAATRDKAHQALQDDPNAYAPLIARLDCLVGGDSVDPTGMCIKIPSCRGDTYEACRTRLQDAGFTATITKHTLSADDAIMEEQADRVTATSPAAGTQTEHDTNITIYVNPDPMPAMTATETAIAEALKTNNPATVNDQNKKTIAHACVHYVTAAGRQSGDCVSLPIFITGNDAGGPATNDRAALIRHPPWVLLHRRVAPPKYAWYDNKPGCETAAKPTDLTRPQCDEYPYWKTLQAYNGAFNSGPSSLTPSIMWTRGPENERQGGALGHFFSANTGGSGPNSYPFSGCNITAQDESALPPLLPSVPGAREAAAAPSAFLNIPLGGFATYKTIGICNKPAAPTSG